MNKKIIIGIIIFIVVALGTGGYFLVNINKSNAPKETKESEEQVNVGNENSKVNTDSKKSLVVYFSVPETDDPNNMTTEEENSAIVVDGKVLGNTQYVAMLISKNTGADIYRIEPKTPYTTDHETLVAIAKDEKINDARPEIKSKISNFDDYDIIYIGYPIWWSDMPKILYTFMELYDFSSKTVIPFSTHGGSELAGTVSTIKNKLSSATIEENAFTMSRDRMEDAPKAVEYWLKEIGVFE